MINFVVFTLLFLFIGIQMGTVISLRENNVKLSRAILHSFILYALPLIIIGAHIKAYKNRDELLKQVIERKKMKKSEEKKYIKKMKGIYFISIIIISAIYDLLTPQDNIKLFIEISIHFENRKRNETKKEREKIKESIGLFGVLIQFISSIWKGMVTHASEGLRVRKA